MIRRNMRPAAVATPGSSTLDDAGRVAVYVGHSRKQIPKEDSSMADRDIAPGDWVQVARGMLCCGHLTGLEGHIFRVSEIRPKPPVVYQCLWCFTRSMQPDVGFTNEGLYVDLGRLRRLPTLEELQLRSLSAKEKA